MTPDATSIRDAVAAIRTAHTDSRHCAEMLIGMDGDELRGTLIATATLAASLAIELFGPGGVRDFYDYALAACETI